VRRLEEVGLGYLTLERATPSLSAGEAQRLRLAALLGSGLTGVLYVLDEPTIGLHAADVPRLVKMLRALRDLENTVLVIEHDLATIAARLGGGLRPWRGRLGGQIVAEGRLAWWRRRRGRLRGSTWSGGRRSYADPPAPDRRRKGLTIRGRASTT